MPELPEVETVRRVLEKDLVGKRIVSIEIKYENIISDDINYFKENILGKKIVGMSRRGKHLIFNLEDGNILSHLRMEGKYFYIPKDIISDKHIHVVFYLDNGYMLCYKDVRKFGRMCFKTMDELYTTEPLSGLGYDPILDGEPNIEMLYSSLKKKSIAIKTSLLDQSTITGLGNIYVDEVLYLSHINPHMPSNKITKDMVIDIIKYSHDVMEKSILFGGTTIRSYTSSLGVEGRNQDNLYVHTKEICPSCGGKIIKDKTNGRGTYYCPNCQKM